MRNSPSRCLWFAPPTHTAVQVFAVRSGIRRHQKPWWRRLFAQSRHPDSPGRATCRRSVRHTVSCRNGHSTQFSRTPSLSPTYVRAKITACDRATDRSVGGLPRVLVTSKDIPHPPDEAARRAAFSLPACAALAASLLSERIRHRPLARLRVSTIKITLLSGRSMEHWAQRLLRRYLTGGSHLGRMVDLRERSVAIAGNARNLDPAPRTRRGGNAQSSFRPWWFDTNGWALFDPSKSLMPIVIN